MLESLGKIVVLKECTDEELQKVADICQPVTVQEGDRIFEAGAPADFLYFVTDGVVELRFRVTHYLATNEITIDRIRNNEMFGWSALSGLNAYTLSAMAVRGGELLKIPAAHLKTLCFDYHHLGYVLMKNIATVIGGRLELTQRILVDTIQKELDKKERRM